MSDKCVNMVRAVPVVLLLAMALLAFCAPADAQKSEAAAANESPGPGKGGPGYGGFGPSIGWVQEYKDILCRDLDPFNHCFVGYEVGRVPLFANGYYGYGPWRRPP